jgi:hypothetical protein
LTGTWHPAQIFILQQNLQLYDFYTAQLSACDSEMERYYQAMESRADQDAPLPDLPKAKPGSRSKNEPNFNVRAQLARIVGVELVGVMGLSASSAQTISTEIGTDMTRFPTVKHFCAWLGLAPRNDISGGKVLRSRTLKVRSRANQAFRQAAESVARSQSSFGRYDSIVHDASPSLLLPHKRRDEVDHRYRSDNHAAENHDRVLTNDTTPNPACVVKWHQLERSSITLPGFAQSVALEIENAQVMPNPRIIGRELHECLIHLDGLSSFTEKYIILGNAISDMDLLTW